MNEKRHESTEDFFGGMFGKQSFHIPDVKSSFSTFGSSLKDTGIDYSDQEENDSSLANTSESPLIHIEEAMMEPTTIPPPGADVIRTDEIDGDVASSESARGGNSDNCARYTVGENTPKIVARCIFNEEVYPEVDIQPNQQQIIPYGNLTVVSGSDKSAQSTISIS